MPSPTAEGPLDDPRSLSDSLVPDQGLTTSPTGSSAHTSVGRPVCLSKSDFPPSSRTGHECRSATVCPSRSTCSGAVRGSGLDTSVSVGVLSNPPGVRRPHPTMGLRGLTGGEDLVGPRRTPREPGRKGGR